MVAGVGVTAPTQLLTTCTVHATVPPPPLPEPLHWVTAVVAVFAGVMLLVQVRAACAAPWHSVTETLEVAAFVARSRLLVTVTSQATAWPPTLSVPLHWLTDAGGGKDEELAGLDAEALVT